MPLSSTKKTKRLPGFGIGNRKAGLAANRPAFIS